MVSRYGELECERAVHCLTAGAQRYDQDTMMLKGCSLGGHKSLHLSRFSPSARLRKPCVLPRLFHTISHKTGVVARPH
jgi:hypothetical protein